MDKTLDFVEDSRSASYEGLDFQPNESLDFQPEKLDFQPAFLTPGEIERARQVPNIAATTGGGPKVSLPDEGVGMASLIQEGGVTGATFAGLRAAQEPIVGLQKRLGVTPEQVSGAMQAVGPILSEAFGVPVAEAVRQMGQPSTPPTTGEKLFAGGQRGVIGAIEGLESPAGLATIGVGAGARLGVQAATEALPAINAAFALQMAASVPGLAKNAVDAIKHGDSEQAALAITQGILTGYFTAESGKGAISALRQNAPQNVPQNESTLRGTIEPPAGEPAKTTEVPNATEKEVAPPGALPAEQRQPAQPAPEGQAQVGAPQRGSEGEKAPPPLTPEEQAAARAELAATQEEAPPGASPVADAAKEASDWRATVSEWQKAGSSLTAEAYKIGDGAVGNEDFIGQLRYQLEQAHDSFSRAVKAKDLNAAAALTSKVQFYREAIERATRTGSAEFARQAEAKSARLKQAPTLLRQEGVPNEDIADLISGKTTPEQVVDKTLPTIVQPKGITQGHDEAYDQARDQGIARMQAILNGEDPDAIGEPVTLPETGRATLPPLNEPIRIRGQTKTEAVPEVSPAGSRQAAQGAQSATPSGRQRGVNRARAQEGLPPTQPALAGPVRAVPVMGQSEYEGYLRQSLASVDKPNRDLLQTNPAAFIAEEQSRLARKKSILQELASLPRTLDSIRTLTRGQVEKLWHDGKITDGLFYEYAKEWNKAPRFGTKMREGPLPPEPAANEPAPVAVGAAGPGAMTAGGPYRYPAIQQLTDRLNAVPPVGAREQLRLGDRAAAAWAEGKSAIAGALARVVNVGQALRRTAIGIRDINDVDRSIGSFQLLVQESLSRSVEAGRAMERQMPNQTAREASAILAESTPQSAGLAASQLPADTAPNVRRAVELAANPTPEVLEFLQDHQRFFQLREQDAINADIFEEGLKDYFTHIWGSEENMPGSLRGAIASGKVSTYFPYGQRRTIPTLLDGILAGKTPILDPAKVVPFYNYSLDRVIASRQFVRRLMDLDDAGDGRPIISPAGAGKYVEPGEQPNAAILVTPRATGDAIADYKPVDHPALQQWKWVTKTPEGAQVFVKGDARVHPAHAERIARMMDRSRLTPSAPMQAALRIGTEVKGFKLGLLSAFHNVHVGSHAAFHWTNPFRAMRQAISFDDPFTRFAVEQGHITLAPSPAELALASEGLLGPGLVHKFPILGPWSKAWSEFTFGTQIPRLKLATFRNAFHRNIWARDHLPGAISGLKGLTDEQVAARVGDSVNNAFGELNHAFLGRLGRSPEFQRALRVVFLAPDFGEARLRFVGKALTKTGFEERLALATMFATLYTSARVGNWLSHGDPEWDWRRAFAVRTGNHWWTMRSVVGDLDHALSDFGRFMYVRLNPVYSRTLSDALFGRDISGKKLTWPAIGQRLAEQVLPIHLGGLTRDDQKLWESFMTSMGGSTYRDTPQQDVTRWAQQWLMGAGHEPVGEFIPSDGPTYAKLRAALRIGSDKTAKGILDGLMKTHRIDQVVDAMKEASDAPFTRSRALEAQFVSSLTPPQQNRYAEALQERQAEFGKFLEFLSQQ